MLPPVAQSSVDDNEMTLPGAFSGDLQPGARIADIVIESLFARGRHGPTYRARDPDFGLVIVKEYRPRAEDTVDTTATTQASAVASDDDVEFAAGLTLFRLMGQALCEVRHPNLVSVRRCIEARGTAYLVMDYIDSKSLDDVLNGGGGAHTDTPLRELLLALLGALDRLHGAGLLHCDVKPANIRLDPEGTPVLVDFGAAVPADLAAAPPYQSLPTSRYAAPEQYRKDARQGSWTDFYGLAAVAYQVVTGTAPPDAPSRAGGTSLIPAVEAGHGRYAEPMLASIDRALSLLAVDRPQSAEAWMAALRPLAAAPAVEADPDPAPQSAITTPRDEAQEPDASAKALPMQRRRQWVAAAVLVLLAVPAAMIGGRAYYHAYIKSDWIVDANGNGDVKNLMEAMTRARSGATIRVRPGRYAAPLVMTRPMTIAGDGDIEEIVVAASDSGPCMTITAKAGAISGLSFVGGGRSGHAPAAACIDIAGASTVSVFDTIIRGAAGPALRVGADAVPVIRGNHIATVSGPAVIVQDRAGGAITGNAIVASGAAGVLVRDAAAPQVRDNRIDSAGQAGILVAGDSAPEVSENRITNSAWSGIEVRGQADPAVARNRIDGAGQAGIYVYEGGRGTYQGNIVISSTFSGVVVGPGGDPTVTDNRIAASNEHGILILAEGAGRYSGNTIIDNAGYGIAVDIGADVAPNDLKRGENMLSGNRKPQIAIGKTPAPQPEPGLRANPASAGTNNRNLGQD